jgi:hypothetical protein
VAIPIMDHASTNRASKTIRMTRRTHNATLQPVPDLKIPTKIIIITYSY